MNTASAADLPFPRAAVAACVRTRSISPVVVLAVAALTGSIGGQVRDYGRLSRPNGSGLQMSTVRKLLLAWLPTLPAAMLLSGTLYWMFAFLF